MCPQYLKHRRQQFPHRAHGLLVILFGILRQLVVGLRDGFAYPVAHPELGKHLAQLAHNGELTWQSLSN